MANQFEKDFEAQFPKIRKKIGAFLFRLYPPMRCVGMRGTCPVFVPTGRALYDVSGWLPIKALDVEGYRLGLTGTEAWRQGDHVALSIGIELKENKQRHPSVQIIGADKDGTGLQAHQLEALAALHRDGGVARLLWSNGGVIGVLDGEDLSRAWYDYGVSLIVEAMGKGKVPSRGSRSIKWDCFRKIDMIEEPWTVILPPFKEPTLDETIRAKNRKAAKLFEKAQKEQEEADANPDSGAHTSGVSFGEDIPY